MKSLVCAVLVASIVSSSNAFCITFDEDGILQSSVKKCGFKADGSCYNLNGDLQIFNDQLKAMAFEPDYRCVVWENYDCHGDHTYAFVSFGQPTSPDQCGLFNVFSDRASSFRCCHTGRDWCAGGEPHCSS